MILSPVFTLLAFLWVVCLSRATVLAYYGHETSEKYSQNLLQRREWYVASSFPSYATDCPVTGERLLMLRRRPLTVLPLNVCNIFRPSMVRTRFDEFQALHGTEVADRVHVTG